MSDAEPELSVILCKKKRWRLVHLPIILSPQKLKNAHKSSNIFKPSAHDVVRTGTNITNNMAFLVLYRLGKVRMVFWSNVQPPSFFLRRIGLKRHHINVLRTNNFITKVQYILFAFTNIFHICFIKGGLRRRTSRYDAERGSINKFGMYKVGLKNNYT